MTEVYRKAFTEVYEIINNLENNDYNKIPKDVVQAIESNRDKEYEYFFDETVSLTEQEMLPETKAILFNFFRDYLSTKEQKEKIIVFQINERMRLEDEKTKKYNIDIFTKKDVQQSINKGVQETALTKVKRNNIIVKLISLIKSIFSKNRK